MDFLALVHAVARMFIGGGGFFKSGWIGLEISEELLDLRLVRKLLSEIVI